jgi:hypothetical protein
MSATTNTTFKISSESDDMHWFSLQEIGQLVQEDKAQQRALEMARNAFLLFDVLAHKNQLPKGSVAS